MKRYYKIMAAVIALLATTALSATAQTTADTTATDIPKRSISYGNTAVDYSDSYRVLGRRHDQMVMVGQSDSTGYTPYYWKARTIDGFYVKGIVQVAYDMGQGSNAFGHKYGLGIGFTYKWIDLGASVGRNYLANPYVIDRKYSGWFAFLEPTFIVARWNKETEIHRFGLGPIGGFQEREIAAVTTYEDDNVVLNVDDSGLSSAVAVGAKAMYQFRQYMGGWRVSVELGFHTYTTTYSNYVEVNGVPKVDEMRRDWRFNVWGGVSVGYQFGRTANNYASAAR